MWGYNKANFPDVWNFALMSVSYLSASFFVERYMIRDISFTCNIVSSFVFRQFGVPEKAMSIEITDNNAVF